MKKVLIILGSIVGLAFLITLGYQLSGSSSDDDMMMDNIDTYAFYYLRLSEEDQVTADQVFAQALIDGQISTLSVNETIAIINQIENEIESQLGLQSTYFFGGMMRSYDDFDSQMYSYEWYYVHTDTQEQSLIDAKYAELLQETDFSTLSLTEAQAAIDSVKVDMISYIESLN